MLETKIPTIWTKQTYKKFINDLEKLSDKKYLEFIKSLTPTKYRIIGIRIPILRDIAKHIKSLLMI